MSSWDRIREHEDGLRYDDFYCAPRGSYGHPLVDPGERTASSDLIERARAALSWSSDARFSRLVARFSGLFD
jgi:hypothetical protein